MLTEWFLQVKKKRRYHLHQQQLPFKEGLMCTTYCAKCFTYIITFILSLKLSVIRCYCDTPVIEEETEVQSVKPPVQKSVTYHATCLDLNPGHFGLAAMLYNRLGLACFEQWYFK